jgi:hypothetical protein
MPILIDFIKLMENKYSDITYVFHSNKDQNNLIHTAIKIIKKKTDNCRLRYDQAKHLAKCYNLCKKSGYKNKRWEHDSLCWS